MIDAKFDFFVHTSPMDNMETEDSDIIDIYKSGLGISLKVVVMDREYGGTENIYIRTNLITPEIGRENSQRNLQTEDPGTGLPPKSYRENVGVTDQTHNVRHYVFSNFPTQAPDCPRLRTAIEKERT